MELGGEQETKIQLGYRFDSSPRSSSWKLGVLKIPQRGLPISTTSNLIHFTITFASSDPTSVKNREAHEEVRRGRVEVG